MTETRNGGRKRGPGGPDGFGLLSEFVEQRLGGRRRRPRSPGGDEVAIDGDARVGVEFGDLITARGPESSAAAAETLLDELGVGAPAQS